MILELIVPRCLPVAPRPVAGELLSSWIERIAAANAITGAELLKSVTDCLSMERQHALLDYCLAPTLRCALAIAGRVSDLDVQALELGNQFRNLQPEWVLPGAKVVLISVAKPGICTECIAEQHIAGVPMHLRAEWALAFLTHCPKHFRWLSISCPICYCSGSYAFTAAASNLLCARCGHPIPLHFFTGDYKASTVAVVLLQSQMLRTIRGLPPDPFWLGAISAERFLSTINDILRLLTHRENGEGSILANSLGPCEYSSYQPLTRGIEHPPLCTLPARLRLTLMAALAQFLLGPRSAAYFESAQNVRASEKPCYPLSRMAPAPDEWEFLETRLRFWPFYLRERLSAALGHMRTRRPSGQSCPTRTGIFIFKYIILKIKYNVLHWILAFKYNKVACGEVFLVFKYCATPAPLAISESGVRRAAITS